METACDGLAALCRMPLENAWPLVTATNALTGRVRTRKLEEILWAAAAAPDASPFIGDALAVLWKKRSGLGKLSQAKRLIRHETVGRRAVLALVDELAEQQKKTASARPIGHRLQIWLLLRRHGGWLRRDPEGWGRVGHLFSINDDARRMLRWFNGWESRPKVEPWMLNNLVAVLLNNGRWDDALKVCRGLVHLPCRDHTTKDSQLLLAVDDLSRGDAATAERRMEGLEEKHFGEFYKLVYRCYAALRDVHWILNASELDPAKRKTALKKRVQTWKDSLPGNSSWGTAHRCVFRKTSRHLAQATGIKTFNTFLPSMRAALTPVQIALCFFVLLSLVAFAIGLFSWFTAPPPAPPPQTVPTTHTPRRFSPFEPKMQQDRRAFDPAAPWSAAPGPPPELETEKARLHEIEKLLRP